MFIQAKWFLSKVLPRSEKGQGLVEYALILLLIAIAVLAVVGIFGQQLVSAYQSFLDEFPG
jgi:Flp pilus assembly pilin Flp